MSEVFKRMVNERAAERRLIVKPSMKSDDKAEHNKWYFESYDDISIHHEMIFVSEHKLVEPELNRLLMN